jgi:hypothetical protein
LQRSVRSHRTRPLLLKLSVQRNNVRSASRRKKEQRMNVKLEVVIIPVSHIDRANRSMRS